MDKQELKQLIKDNCNYSEPTIDYLVDKTTVEFIPTFTCNNITKHSNIKKYIDYFFGVYDHPLVLIDNKDVDTSELLTKFKIGDVVYYFDKTIFSLIRGEITSIRSCLMSDSKGRRGISLVGIKRLDEDVDFVCDYITNDDLFLTIDEATESLINNTFRLEHLRKQERYNDLVQDELTKFNDVNDD